MSAQGSKPIARYIYIYDMECWRAEGFGLCFELGFALILLKQNALMYILWLKIKYGIQSRTWWT